MAGIYLAIGVVVLVSFIDHFEKSKVIANQRFKIESLEREIKKLNREDEQFTTLKECNRQKGVISGKFKFKKER